MNVDYVRQVAAECDGLLGRLTTEMEAIPELRLRTVEALARAAAVLHMAVLPPESHGERPNGSGSAQDTGETSTGQQRTAEPAVACQYCGADCTDGRSWDGGDLYACTRCANHRSELNKLRKRWHEAATQRDHLAHAARKVLARGGPTTTALDELETAVETLDHGEALPHANADRLRRELWHVLDRMPASDDNLIATVKKLKEGQ